MTRLLVHMELQEEDHGVLAVAASLARRFSAAATGMALCQPLPPLYEEGVVTGEVLEMDRLEMARECAAAEERFRTAMAGHAKDAVWRSHVTAGNLVDMLAAEARGADLIVTGPDIGGGFLDSTRRVSVGALVMKAGRPVLLVPRKIAALKLNHAVLAWKDGREARRAAIDALPLLELAGAVTVLEVAAPHDAAAAEARLREVADWLGGHGIAAQTRVAPLQGNDVDTLRHALSAAECDLVVAGAFGHSRLREWMFGGVTGDLLLSPPCCVLLSH